MARLTDEMLRKLKEMQEAAPETWIDLILAEIERLREQNRELREALRPFAAFEYADRWPDDELLFYHNGAEVTIGDVRRAKAVLEKG